MKTVINKDGWSDITTKNFKIISFHKHMPNITVEQWIISNERVYRGKQKGMRVHCACCKTPWKNISGKINSIMTNKGNQAVCDECFETLIDKK